jgi:threonine dehydrogenase-like Zn-dependent dehydrogenase
MGADLALDPAEEIEGPIMEMTDARGADVVFEASGSPAAFAAGERLTCTQGRLMLVAVYEGRRLELHANRVLGNELDVLASFWANDTDFRRAVDLVASRKLDVRPLISEHVALDDLQNAFERLAADRGRYAKILVDCNS